MPKRPLTVGDICKIREILLEQKSQETDNSKKNLIDELIIKLSEMEIRA